MSSSNREQAKAAGLTDCVAKSKQDRTTGTFRSVNCIKRRWKRQRRAAANAVETVPFLKGILPDDGLSYTPPPRKPRPKLEPVSPNSLLGGVPLGKRAYIGGVDYYWECGHCGHNRVNSVGPCPVCRSYLSNYKRGPLPRDPNTHGYSVDDHFAWKCTHCNDKYVFYHSSCVTCRKTGTIKMIVEEEKKITERTTWYCRKCDITHRGFEDNRCPSCTGVCCDVSDRYKSTEESDGDSPPPLPNTTTTDDVEPPALVGDAAAAPDES